jgi:hypothetical protein
LWSSFFHSLYHNPPTKGHLTVTITKQRVISVDTSSWFIENNG